MEEGVRGASVKTDFQRRGGRYGTTHARQSSTDVGKGKPFTRQLSKGVSGKKSVILCVQINTRFSKPNLAVETNFPNKFRAYLSSKGFLVGIFLRE